MCFGRLFSAGLDESILRDDAGFMRLLLVRHLSEHHTHDTAGGGERRRTEPSAAAWEEARDLCLGDNGPQDGEPPVDFADRRWLSSPMSSPVAAAWSERTRCGCIFVSPSGCKLLRRTCATLALYMLYS